MIRKTEQRSVEMNSQLTLHENGSFHIRNVTDLSYTYFPLCNPFGMKSAISPAFAGDATVDHNSFLLMPTSVEDLTHSLMRRHVFFRIDDAYTWSITGMTAHQTLTPDRVDLHGDFLVHKIVRANPHFTCSIESFVPSHDTYQEWHKITLKNTTSKPLSLKSVIGIPIYGRSADTLRDHRHVTSLLNRVKIAENGLINHPTFSFDERGHVLNKRHYGVFAHSSHHTRVQHYYPTLEAFVGEGQTLLDPDVVKKEIPSTHRIGDVIAGYEAMAGMAYETVTLHEHEELSLVIALMIGDDEVSLHQARPVSVTQFDTLKEATQAYWKNVLAPLQFHFPEKPLNGWLKWVTLQPELRRIYGNSFLPYHDYGRGGKGWRDLWQDLLALILMRPEPVRAMLINNFKGVRIDGSNATIIGDRPGVFLADRNHITRIWMDHGSWPFLTTRLYLDQSGDVALLFEKATYFQDQFTHYTKQAKQDFVPGENVLKTHEGATYYGTILEHLLIQNLVPYYHVGAHNNIRLEDADWNDGLDMASNQGESVAFTAFYGQNLVALAKLLHQLHGQGITKITLFVEIDTLLQATADYDVTAKNSVLQHYFETVKAGVSGKTRQYETLALAKVLLAKGEALLAQVRENEWLEEAEEGWFNGYYDDDAVALDDVKQKHMTLTGQVFAIMSGAATKKQVDKIIRCADTYLYDQTVGGYRLNTDFKTVKTNMGRLFGFAYGHKENGAMFSHMAVMYANALYQRGYVTAGDKVIKAIYSHSMDLKHAKMYPGIAEYYNPKGRGMYPYLTGSASWLILTLVTEVFGIKGDLGLPVFEPKLLLAQFKEETTLAITTLINERRVTVVYDNPMRLNYGDYHIGNVVVDDEEQAFSRTRFGVKLLQKITGDRVVVVLKAK
ncbi:MAG: cellobiose phosphorylase [Acholeplasmatales bacterium]|nr:MAG: cellobiose phosphorylase [Acholeplasmatales bacterium]